MPGRVTAVAASVHDLYPENLPITDVFPARGAVFGKKVLFLHCFHEALSREILGVPGFDSRQSLIVSTPSAVWRLVNPDAQDSNGNTSYALAAYFSRKISLIAGPKAVRRRVSRGVVPTFNRFPYGVSSIQG